MTGTIWDSDNPYPPYKYVENRWEIIGYTWPKPSVDDCPGKGKCHGCICWCDWCGDVKDVCNAEWPGCCDTHKRYPEQPEHLKPNPDQLFLPGFSSVVDFEAV